jgi:hypothetical protein
LGLAGTTTGKGKTKLRPNQRPLEVQVQHNILHRHVVTLTLAPQVFMCSIVKRTGYGEGLQWVAQYVKGK